MKWMLMKHEICNLVPVLRDHGAGKSKNKASTEARRAGQAAGAATASSKQQKQEDLLRSVTLSYLELLKAPRAY